MERFQDKYQNIDGTFREEVFAITRSEQARSFPTNFPVYFARIAEVQKGDRTLQKNLKKGEPYKKEIYRHSDKEYELITWNGRIVIPKALQEMVSCDADASRKQAHTANDWPTFLLVQHGS